jgi:hypothetical protein
VHRVAAAAAAAEVAAAAAAAVTLSSARVSGWQNNSTSYRSDQQLATV